MNKLEIEDFDLVKHLDQLNLWCEQWHIPTSFQNILSSTGLIIQNHACLFIYETNSPLVMFENLISNKELNKKDRKKALDLLIKKAEEIVFKKGFRKIMITTNNKSLLKRAMNDNWEYPFYQYNILYKNVSSSGPKDCETESTASLRPIRRIKADGGVK